MRTILFITLISIALTTNAQLKVATNGYIGVGLATANSPANKLDVNGNIQISNATVPMGLMTEVGGTTPLLNLSVNFREPNKNTSYLGGAFRIDTRNMSSMPLFQWLSSRPGYNESTLMELTSNGQLGIGRHPSCALDVTGVIQMNGSAVTSDERLKEDIKNMSGSLLSLSRLHGVTYKLKPINTDISGLASKALAKTDSASLVPVKLHGMDSVFYSRNHMGFLAQEIQTVYPELVYTNKDGILSVDYISLIPVLVESLKELDTRTADYSTLQQDLQNTKNKLAALEKRLDQCCGKSNLKSAQDIPVDENSTVSSVLYQNVPNPFTQNTDISYYLAETIKTATLYIYNMQGLQIKSIAINTRGNGKETVNGSELQAGMYIYTLIADGREVDTKRMILTQ